MTKNQEAQKQYTDSTISNILAEGTIAKEQAASLTGFPPDEATKGDSSSGFGASTFFAGWVSLGAFSAGTTTGAAGVSVAISTSPSDSCPIGVSADLCPAGAP